MPADFLAPEYLIFSFILILVISINNNYSSKKFFYIFEIIFLLGALFLTFICDSPSFKGNWLAWNYQISLVKRLILFTGWASAFLARRLFLDLSAQFLLFLACAFGGALLIIQSNNFLLLFISLEIHSFSLCSLMGFKNRDYLEGIRKYFILSLLPGVFFLYGVSWFFQIFGSFVFSGITTLSPLKIFLLSASLFSIIVRISLFPFHAFGGYVLENSSTFICMLISTVSGISFSFIAERLLKEVFNLPIFCELFMVLGLSSFVFLGIQALRETSIKKLIFNIGISQIGFFFFRFL